MSLDNRNPLLFVSAFCFLMKTAQAETPTILGPDGLIAVGVSSHNEYPFFPSLGQEYYGYESIWVDLVDGGLNVIALDSPEVIRRYSDGVWALPEGHENIDYRINTYLNRVTGTSGAIWDYRYDSESRLREFRWPNGGVVRIRYDGEGRVSQIDGPSSERMSLSWKDDLRIEYSNGKQYRIEIESNEGEVIKKVTDGLGRSFQSVEKQGKIDIEDPRGLHTIIQTGSDGMSITDVFGSAWNIDIENNQLKGIIGPSGEWSWRSDEKSVTIKDSGGRTQYNRYDDFGRVVEQQLGMYKLRYNYNQDNKLREIRDGLGHAIYFGHDQNGAIRLMEDAVGGAFVFRRDSNGHIISVVGRNGQTWRLERDVMGRIRSVITPEGLTFSIKRNLRGEIIGFEESFVGTTQIDRDAAGHISRIVTPQGDEYLLMHNSNGRLNRVVYPDGLQKTFQYDRMGWLTGVNYNNQKLNIQRDTLGRITLFDTWRVQYGMSGQVAQIEDLIKINRDGSGLISKLEMGSYILDIKRDLRGMPVSWADPSSEVSVERDSNGRIVLRTDTGQTRNRRDPRGWVSSNYVSELEWRYLRSASGYLLKNVLPSGKSMGFERDNQMGLHWIRYPSGSLQRFEKAGRDVTVQLWSSEAQLISEQKIVYDDQAQIQSIDDTFGAFKEYTRKYDGQLERIESNGQPLLIKNETSLLTEDGTLTLYNPDQRPSEILVPPPFTPYGLDVSSWRYQYDELGRIDLLDGQSIVWFVEYDDLSRISQLCGSSGCWEFRYSPFGLLDAFRSPEGFWTPLIWTAEAPDLSIEENRLLMMGASQIIYAEGLILFEDKVAGKSLVYDPAGKLEWVETQNGLTKVIKGAGGLYTELEGIQGRGCGFQPILNGPMFCGPVAYDSISGQSFNGQLGQDLLPEWLSLLTPPQNLSLRYGVQLDQYPDPINSNWIEIPNVHTVPWINSSLEGGTNPFGDHLGKLAISLTELEAYFFYTILEGKKDGSSAELLATILQQEHSLKELKDPWLGLPLWWIEEDIFYPGLAHFPYSDKLVGPLWWE